LAIIYIHTVFLFRKRRARSIELDRYQF